MKHYLYRHIRLDKNEPFYIGIGTKSINNPPTYESEYTRAFSKEKSRKDSKIWKLVVNKTNYIVEILMESDDYSFIKQKEKEFIKLYGRIDNKTGILANMTDGGDGSLGYVHSDKSKNKLRETIRKNKANYNYITRKIYQYDKNGNFTKEWKSISEAAVELKVHKSTLNKTINHEVNNNYCKGYYWSLIFSDKIKVKPFRRKDRKPVVMLDSISLEEIKKFDRVTDAFIYLNRIKANGFISKAIKNRSLAYGYKWKEV